MIKKALTAVAAATIASSAAAQVDMPFHEDFDGGMPATFTTMDRDENPITPVYYKGVQPSPSWTVGEISSEGNNAAFSFSRSTFDMEQDNWLITPAIKLPEGSEPVLRWAARSVAENFPEDYKVMVSASGTEPSAFTELASVAGERYFWTERALSLADYAGQTVNIAFVCTSLNKFILAIDDIYVGEPQGYSFTAKTTSSHFAGTEATAPVSGILTNTGRKATVAAVCLNTASGSTTKQCDLTLQPGDTMSYAFNMPIEPHSVNRYTVSLRFADGADSTVHADSVVASYFPRTLVLDEGTGNWCNTCPSMMPYLAEVKERMGSDVIVITTHISDPLTCKDYSSQDGMGYVFQGSIPVFTYNRSESYDYKNYDVYHTDGFLERAMLLPTYAMITATAEQQGAEVAIKANVQFAKDYDNRRGYYTVGFALIDNAYEQHDIPQNNNCTTISDEEYRYMPVAIPGEMMVYRDLPIEASTAFAGIEGSLPEEIKAGETYTVDYRLPIPDSLTYGDDELTVVGFVFQKRSYELLNATAVPLTYDRQAVGIGSVAAASGATISRRADGSLAVALPGGAEGVASVYSLDGRLVRQAAVGGGSATVDCRGLKGCYVVKVAAGGSEAVAKVVL